MVRVAAMLGEQQGDFYADNRSMKYFEAILQHSPKIVSAYVGLNDGQFRQARRLTPDAVLFGKQVPAGTRFSYHWLEYPNGARGGRPQRLPRRQRPGPGRAGGADRLRPAQPHVVSRHGGGERSLHHRPRRLRHARPDRLHRRAAVQQGRRGAGRGRHRHHARRPVAIHRRAQGQPQHAELRARPGRPRAGRPRTSPRPTPPTRARSTCATSATSRTSCRRSPTVPIRATAAARSTASPMAAQRVFRQPVDPAGRFRQALAALHRHAGRRLHRRLRPQQPAAAHGRDRRDGAGARRHLFPVGHAVGAARAAGGQGDHDREDGRRAAAARALQGARDRRAGARHRHARLGGEVVRRLRAGRPGDASC